MTRKATPLLLAEAARLLRIERRLQVGDGATFLEMESMLAISRATLKRDLRLLREQLEAPIVFDRVPGRYRIVGVWPGVVAHLLEEVATA